VYREANGELLRHCGEKWFTIMYPESRERSVEYQTRRMDKKNYF